MAQYPCRLCFTLPPDLLAEQTVRSAPSLPGLPGIHAAGARAVFTRAPSCGCHPRSIQGRIPCAEASSASCSVTVSLAAEQFMHCGCQASEQCITVHGSARQLRERLSSQLAVPRLAPALAALRGRLPLR